MRKMVQTAEADRDSAIQRSAMVAKQAAQQSSDDIRGQLGKLAGLERDHMKLTAQHSIAEVSNCTCIDFFFFIKSLFAVILKYSVKILKTFKSQK